MAPLLDHLTNTFSFYKRSLSTEPYPLFPLIPRSLTPPYKDPTYRPGLGTIPPQRVNNHGFFALFALLGAALVLLSIWFFFWAKNGGFHFRKGDWDDYKSTVLRRKGPNGTTLSGATKTTRLGGGSVVADGGEGGGEGLMGEKGWRRGEEDGNGKKGKRGRKNGKPRGSKNNDDEDVRAYRHEKPARVGGLNRESDGVFHQDFAYSDTQTSYSDDMRSSSHPPSSIGGGHVPINTPREKKNSRWTTRKSGSPNASQQQQQPTTPSPKKNKSTFYAQTPQSNASSDSQRPLRPNAQSPGGTSTPSRSRQHSPTKHQRKNVPGSFRDFAADGLEFEGRYNGSASASDAGLTEDSRGTKAYFHPIPGLGGGGAVRGGGGNGGFRRGMGRRDSLSDSEGETMGS